MHPAADSEDDQSTTESNRIVCSSNMFSSNKKPVHLGNLQSDAQPNLRKTIRDFLSLDTFSILQY